MIILSFYHLGIVHIEVRLNPHFLSLPCQEDHVSGLLGLLFGLTSIFGSFIQFLTN